MWKFFKRKTKGQATIGKGNIFSSVLEKRIYPRLKKLADCMGMACAKLPRTSLILIASAIILPGLFYSGYVITRSISDFTAVNLKISPIRRPDFIDKTGEPGLLQNRADVSNGADLRRIKRFRAYIDSLAKTPSGKSRLEEIIRHRPGLLDSLEKVENFYELIK